jgi:tocopherol cyclase-like protein
MQANRKTTSQSAESGRVDALNARRWDGQSRGHYEVWYLTFNHRATQTGYWIRYTLESPLSGHGEPYAQLWFARSDARDPRRTFGINRRFPIAAMTAAAEPFAVGIGAVAATATGAPQAALASDSARGSLSGDGHTVRWDLRWAPGKVSYRQLPDVMYRRGGLGETTVLSPSLDTRLHGTVTIDGETITLDAEPGDQTHLWGKKHAFEWAWGHCNSFVDRPGAALETLTVRLRRRGVTLPPLTVFSLFLDGEMHAFNQFRHTLRNRGSFSTGRYNLSGQHRDLRIEAEFRCRPDDMVVAPYVDPDGEPSWCANTTVGELRVSLLRRSGGRFREVDTLVSPHGAHFEVAGRSRDATVVRDHVTLG